MTEVTDDQIYDPFDDSVEDEYDDNHVIPSARTTIRKILARSGGTRSIIIIKESEKKEPGLYYLNYAENTADEGRHWIASTELFDPANKFALLNAGINSWGLKMFLDQFRNGFEDHYHRYGGVGAVDYDYDNDALVYLVRFHNQEALDQFKQTAWYIPLHHFAPLPKPCNTKDLFVDTNHAQLYGWRERFKDSGFTDDEIMGIVNTHHDFDRMELLFFNDTEMLNKIYRYVGGKWGKKWLLRNIKDNDCET